MLMRQSVLTLLNLKEECIGGKYNFKALTTKQFDYQNNEIMSNKTYGGNK